MEDLHKVGVFLRDAEQDFPLEELQRLFAKTGVEMVVLDEVEDLEVGLVVAMGGDGTVLQALDRYPQCPILAINYGTVGFLTAADRNDLERVVGLLACGDYLVSERLVLQCDYPGGSVFAINEVAVRISNGFAFVDVSVDDTKIRTIQGDGVVVGTPTGSTAFLLATGAPLVMPEVRCIVLDGINEFNFTSRALILSPDSHLCLQISKRTRACDLYLNIDGRQLTSLRPGENVRINQAQHNARLIYFEENYFFHNLSSKLSWD